MTGHEIDAVIAESTTGPVSVRASRCALAGWLAHWGFQHGVEVGVWRGGYSQELFKANPSLRLIGVDPWRAYGEYHDKKNDQARLDEARRGAVELFAKYTGGELWRVTSQKAAARVPDGSLDFVYLDGNHGREFIDADLAAWVPKVRSGGVVSGHDYAERTPADPGYQVKAAVDAFTADRGIAPWFVLAKDKHPSWFWRVP